MSISPLSLIKTGMMQSGGAAPFAEQGVTADGTQKLDFGAVAGADDPDSLFFFSGTPTDVKACIAHWGDVNSSGQWLTDETTGGSDLDPSGKYLLDASSPAGVLTNASLGVGRIHLLWNTEVNGSDVKIKWAAWDSGSGWQTGESNRATATNVEFTTQGGDLTLLSKRNDAIPYNGDIYRMALWIGTTADVHLTATQDLFTSGGGIVDPATSLASLGDTNRIFDAYGNATTWNSGTFPKGSFTKTGNAFTDV